MKRTLPILAITAILAATAPAQTQTLVSFRDGSVSQTIATPRLTLHDLFGKKGLDLQGWAFGGFQYSPGQPLTGGIAGSFHRDISRELALDLGLYGRSVVGGKLDFGLFVGFGIRI